MERQRTGAAGGVATAGVRGNRYKVARVEIDRWSHFRRCACVAVCVMITSCGRRPCLVRLGYSPIHCCVPGLGLETSNPCARALDNAISTRLDSTRLDSTRPEWGAELEEGRKLISGVVGNRGAGSCAHGSWGGEEGRIPWLKRGSKGVGQMRAEPEISEVRDCRRPERTSANPQLVAGRADKQRDGTGQADAAPGRAGQRGKSRGRASSSSGHVSI